MAVLNIIPTLQLDGTARHSQNNNNKTRSYTIYISYMFYMREEEPGVIWLTCRNMALELTGSSKSSPAVYDISEYLQFTLSAPQPKEPTKVMHIQRHSTPATHIWDTLDVTIYRGHGLNHIKTPDHRWS